MNRPNRKSISPIGQTSQEAASDRYNRDPAYRAAHDRLAPYRVIAQAVILARVARHLTQRDLAGMLGTTDTAISRIESGERAISLETLRKLGAALDIVFLVGSTAAVASGCRRPAHGGRAGSADRAEARSTWCRHGAVTAGLDGWGHDGLGDSSAGQVAAGPSGRRRGAGLRPRPTLKPIVRPGPLPARPRRPRTA